MQLQISKVYWVRAPGNLSSGQHGRFARHPAGVAARTGRQTPVERAGRPRSSVKGNQRRNAGKDAVTATEFPANCASGILECVSKMPEAHFRAIRLHFCVEKP